jgi:hypothetical protein
MWINRPCWWLLSVLLLSACGGGGGGSVSNTTVAPGAISSIPTVSGNNSVAVTLAPSSAASPQVNDPYITVTVCVGALCADITNVLVDTGSYGFRVPASVLAAAGLTPTQVTVPGGNLVECSQFAGGYMWGWVKQATLKIGGEQTATDIPIQVTDDAATPVLPAPDNSCTSSGLLANIGNPGVSSMGGNAIIGVGPMVNDGQRYYYCSTGSGADCTSICAGYFGNSSTSCSGLFSEVSNPVASFNQDNNGIILQLAGVTDAGSVLTNAGTLTFGLNTQSNNSLSGFQAVAHGAVDATKNPDGSYFAITYGCSSCNPSTSSNYGFFDSGSNYTYVNVSTNLLRLDSQSVYNLHNTSTPVTVNATLASAVTTSFLISDPINSNCPTCNAYNDIAASATQYIGGSQVDLGMPYFYGKSIAFAIQTKTVSGSNPTAPFYAVKIP